MKKSFNFWEWFEFFWHNAQKIEGQVNGNLIQGILLKPTRNIKEDGILYLHGGQFDVETSNLYTWQDAITYRAAGYPVLILKYHEEDFGGDSDPNRDIKHIYYSPTLFRDFWNVKKIHIITVSRGGYCGLFAYQLYRGLFGRFVAMCPPIDVENEAWFKAQMQWAKNYLIQKLPSPMVLAKEGAFTYCAKDMFMIGGKSDPTCPPDLHSEKFAITVGCASRVINGFGHDVARSGEARGIALQFIGGTV